MPFTQDNANVNHYPGTTKAATEEGYERSDMAPDDGSQNTGRLTGRCFNTQPTAPVKDSD